MTTRDKMLADSARSTGDLNEAESRTEFAMGAARRDEEAIFQVARKIEARGLREKYLEQACGDDDALRTRLEALLRVHDEDESFLVLSPGVSPAPALTEEIGRALGPYRLTKQIGEGGFGVVFSAEQRQPLCRTVALKVLKPGMDSRRIVARFEAEREALALMDHPGIARVLDAGSTEQGRPYFVMELVPGVPITEFCDNKQLAVAERLELFMHVCDAVQHAHQKGFSTATSSRRTSLSPSRTKSRWSR